uniref:Uncharacterized protein n=1 Tax=Anguilla anguilla TaxID=7936 RepID=A0A0E9U402_ANGAN
MKKSRQSFRTSYGDIIYCWLYRFF